MNSFTNPEMITSAICSVMSEILVAVPTLPQERSTTWQTIHENGSDEVKRKVKRNNSGNRSFSRKSLFFSFKKNQLNVTSQNRCPFKHSRSATPRSPSLTSFGQFCASASHYVIAVSVTQCVTLFRRGFRILKTYFTRNGYISWQRIWNKYK
jgi:hypothetical protein